VQLLFSLFFTFFRGQKRRSFAAEKDQQKVIADSRQATKRHSLPGRGNERIDARVRAGSAETITAIAAGAPSCRARSQRLVCDKFHSRSLLAQARRAPAVAAYIRDESCRHAVCQHSSVVLKLVLACDESLPR
jgi:hypothetical protein